MPDRDRGAPLSEPGGDAPPRWALAFAVTVAVAAVAAVLVLAVTRAPPSPPPLVIAEVPAPRALSVECRTLLAQLPAELGGYERAVLGDPPGTAGWAGPDGASVTLRCGLDRPALFEVGSPIEQINAVQYFRVRSDPLVTYYTVDRPVYIALTLSSDSGSGPVQVLSDILVQIMPAVPIDPAPPR